MEPMAVVRRFRRADLLPAVCVVALVAVVAWLCAFKVMDRDFWWHITAGRVMWETHRLIATDIFAYTRAGMPYLATHEWLAQLILFAVFRAGGTTGVIVFRTLMVLATVAVLLRPAGWRRLPTALPFAVLAVAAGLPAFLERPQLFTFLCLAVTLRLAVAWRASDGQRTRHLLLAAWVALTVAWVNLHGAAALLSVGVWGAMALSWWWDALWSRSRDRRVAPLVTGGCCLLAALLLSPSGWGNITYLASLFSDRTTMFIHEWQPRPALEYWRDQWMWWVIVVVSLRYVRAHRSLAALLCAGFAFLSLQAFRHEVLFVLTGLWTVVLAIADMTDADAAVRFFRARPRIAVLAAIIVVLLAILWARGAYFRLCQRDQLAGYGAFLPARGAVDYLERNGVAGRMFNTYGVGGYLIFRGYPGRLVYIDGRNVDYGFTFMGMTNVAGKDPEAFAALDRQYGFDYAVIDYDAAKDPDLVSYSVHLDHSPLWVLVYIDDLAAVYLKRTAANAALIERDGYAVLNPNVLDIDVKRAGVPASDMPVLREELRRAADTDPFGVKSLGLLAGMLIGEGKCDAALPLVAEARRRQPGRPVPLVLEAACAAAAGDWHAAADLFNDALPLLGNAYPNTNYAYIADVEERAGHPLRAWWLRLRTGAQRKHDETVSEPPAMPNPAADGAEALAEGMRLVGTGDLAGAERAFLDAVMFNPSDTRAWNNLGAVRIQQGRYAEAMEAIGRALEQDPAYGDAELNMALALYRAGDLRGAREHRDRAARLGTDVSRLDAVLR